MVDQRNEAREVLRRIIDGNLAITDFHEQWPAGDDPLLAVVFEEAEDAVEHAPGRLFRRGVDMPSFRRSAAFLSLLVDAEMLSDEFSGVASRDLVAARDDVVKRVVQSPSLSSEAIRGLIRDRLGEVDPTAD